MRRMPVEVLTGPQGSGKTSLMHDQAIRQPGLYLFAAPTRDLIDEQVMALSSKAPSLRVIPIHSSVPGIKNVQRQLAETRYELEACRVDHAVVLITHETMMSADLTEFSGWHARIDEAPAAVQAGRINIGQSRGHFETHYELHGKAEGEWSGVRPIGLKPNWTALKRDSLARPLVEFDKLVRRGDSIFVNARTWDQKDEFVWFAMWTPLSLRGFASVTIAGSSYTDSVGYHAAVHLFDDLFEFATREVPAVRSGQPCVKIHYFSAQHSGSTSFWATSEGRWCIKQVCDHLARVLDEESFWSANEVVRNLMEHRVPGTLIRPAAAGLNTYRDRTSCAYIFSSKSTPDDEALITVLDIDREKIRKAREDDAIAQFAMRGALRNVAYDGSYRIYLYEQGQAERLRDHLLALSIMDVLVQGVSEAGLLEHTRAGGRKARPVPDGEKKAKGRTATAARSKAYRARLALGAGREPGRAGRPSLRKPRQ